MATPEGNGQTKIFYDPFYIKIEEAMRLLKDHDERLNICGASNSKPFREAQNGEKQKENQCCAVIKSNSILVEDGQDKKVFYDPSYVKVHEEAKSLQNPEDIVNSIRVFNPDLMNTVAQHAGQHSILAGSILPSNLAETSTNIVSEQKEERDTNVMYDPFYKRKPVLPALKNDTDIWTHLHITKPHFSSSLAGDGFRNTELISESRRFEEP